jgi:TatA/E family protein of Tat protein translocase
MAAFSEFILLFGISGGEILIILLIFLLLFGPGKIPEIARMIGKGIHEVKKVQQEINSEIHRYSGEIEQEARKMQQSMDEFSRDLTNPGNNKLGITDEPNIIQEQDQGETTPPNTPIESAEEELPSHYRPKIDEEDDESSTNTFRSMN